MNLNFYTLLKKVTLGLFLVYIGLVFSQATSSDAGSSDCECGEPVNVWYKVSTNEEDYGQVIQLDMSKGRIFSNEMFVYIIVKDLEGGDDIIVAFPNSGDWHAQPLGDPFLDELEKEFKNLEDYLKSKSSEEIKKKQ